MKGYVMRRKTKAQVEFRKQMKALEQEGMTKGVGFTSFVERDHIDGYYSRRNKKRLITIGSITAIGLLIVRCMFFTSYGIALYNQVAMMTNLPTLSTVELLAEDERIQIINEISMLGEKNDVIAQYNDNLLSSLNNQDLNMIKEQLQSLKGMEIGSYSNSKCNQLGINTNLILDKSIHMHELVLYNIITDSIMIEVNDTLEDYKALYEKDYQLVLTILEMNAIDYEFEGDLIRMSVR